MKHRIAAALAASALASGGAFAQQYEFDCTITQATSGLAANLTVSVTLPGTLIGNYDAATNPTGTRTKPGLFGTFGSTENVASPVSIVAGFNNVPLNTRPSGSFRLLLDVEGLSARVEGYEVNNLATGPLVIPVTAAVTLQTFRTRAPDSTFIGATVNQEVGDATITTFRDIQSENGNGTLVVAGPDQYTFTVPITLAAKLFRSRNPCHHAIAKLPTTPHAAHSVAVAHPNASAANTRMISSETGIRFADSRSFSRNVIRGSGGGDCSGYSTCHPAI